MGIRGASNLFLEPILTFDALAPSHRDKSRRRQVLYTFHLLICQDSGDLRRALLTAEADRLAGRLGSYKSLGGRVWRI